MIFAALLGCDDGCLLHSDCPPEHQCHHGACLATCGDARPCAEGRCVEGLCRACPDEGPCAEDSSVNPLDAEAPSDAADARDEGADVGEAGADAADVGDGAVDASDGSTDVSDGSTDISDVSTDASDGSVDASDATFDAGDGSTDASDAPLADAGGLDSSAPEDMGLDAAADAALDLGRDAEGASDGGSDDGGVAWRGPHTRVVFEAGQAFIEIDGQRHRPAFIGLNTIQLPAEGEGADQEWANLELQITQARASGAPIVLLALGWGMLRDAAARDRLFARIEALDVYVILRLSAHEMIRQAQIYDEADPALSEAWFMDLEGASTRSVSYRACDPADDACLDAQIQHAPALDEAWRQNIERRSEALLRALDEAHPGRIIGVQLNALSGGEWFFRWEDAMGWDEGRASAPSAEPFFPLYEEATQALFCQRVAPLLPPDAECVMPTPAERSQGTYGDLIDMSTPAGQLAVYANRFTSERLADHIHALAAHAKALSGGKLLTIAFNGYLFEHTRWRNELVGSGHLALSRLLRDPDLDAISAPYDYAHARDPLNAMEPHGPMDSPRLHGKLWIHEDDTRTHLAPPSVERRAEDLWESVQLTQRNQITAALHQTGAYLFDLWGEGWYGRVDAAEDTEAMWQYARWSAARLEGLSDEGPRSFRPEVAVLVDDLSASHHPLSPFEIAAYAHAVYSQPLEALTRIQRPVRCHLLSDLTHPDFPAEDLKLIIFLNAFNLDEATRQLIEERLARDGKALLFIHAAGVMRGDGAADAAHASALIGFEVLRGEGRVIPEALIDDPDWPWLEGEPYGLGVGLDPWFLIPPQEGVTVTARGAEGQALLARADLGTHKVLYAASPKLPRALYRTAADWAGAHGFTDDASDVVEAYGDRLMIRPGRDGARQIRLPWVVDRLIIELEAGLPRGGEVLCEACDGIDVPLMRAGATYLYRWE